MYNLWLYLEDGLIVKFSSEKVSESQLCNIGRDLMDCKVEGSKVLLAKSFTSSPESRG